MCMSADIVERVHPFAGVANHDLTSRDDDRTHAPLRDVGKRRDGLKTQFTHGSGGLSMRSAAL
jgi:hypothetical protein